MRRGGAAPISAGEESPNVRSRSGRLDVGRGLRDAGPGRTAAPAVLPACARAQPPADLGAAGRRGRDGAGGAHPGRATGSGPRGRGGRHRCRGAGRAGAADFAV